MLVAAPGLLVTTMFWASVFAMASATVRATTSEPPPGSVMHSAAMSGRLDKLYQQLWNSVYAEPLRLDYDYPPPKPGGES